MNTEYYEKTLESIRKNNLDAVLIVPSEELEFLLGFSPTICERFQGLFIMKNGVAFIFAMH